MEAEGLISGMFSGFFMFFIYGFIVVAMCVLGWFLWTRFLNFPLKVNLYQRRGDGVQLIKTNARLEKQKDGNYKMNIKGARAYSALFDYKNISKDEVLDVYMPGPNELRPCTVKLVGKEIQIEPMLTPEMMGVFTSTILAIHMLTNPNEFFQTYGFVIYIIVAAVALILVLSPAIDATNNASTAMNSAAGAFTNAANQLSNTAYALENTQNGEGGDSDSARGTGPAPPIFIIAGA